MKIWITVLLLAVTINGGIAAAAADRPEEVPRRALAPTESGEQPESLLTSISPDLEARESIPENREPAALPAFGCGRASAMPTHLSSSISPRPMHASSCGSSSCSGHHMYADYRRCSTGCNSSGWYNFFYSSPNRSPWQNGWRYTGGSTCGDCSICVESGCTNW